MARKSMYSENTFSKDQLPSNRREVFFDVFKLHYFSFVKIGVILFAFAIPLFAINFVKDYSFIIASETGNSNTTMLVTCIAIETVCVLLMSIPIAGLGKIYHEYAWLEPVFFLDDFKKGIKENIKPTLISVVIIAILNAIFNFVYFFVDSGWIIAVPFGFNIAVLYPIIMHTLFTSFIYTNKYWDNFKLGCFFYLRHLPTTLLSIILICAFKVYDLFQFVYIYGILTKYLVFLVIIIFIMPFIFLGVQLNEMRIFDKHINSVRFPHLVNKGLYIENKDSRKEEKQE